MVEPAITFAVALLYFLILFVVASYGDRKFADNRRISLAKPNIYALSMAVYCTTWTFFGSVGLAATSSLSFLAIYAGPIFVITVCFPLVLRVVRLAKEERITSVADFLASRYGKNNKVAAVAAIIAVVGTIPYIALQLKAIASSVGTLFVNFESGIPAQLSAIGDISLFVALTLAVFAVLFGTRHADATEHQNGLMLAIAMESVVKLVAFLAVGIFVTWGLFDGFGDLIKKASENERVLSVTRTGFDINQFLIMTLLSFSAFLLLPRVFHVAVVENNSPKELARARWLFPFYLVAINFFVVPIAIAGMIVFDSTSNADDFVLLLPIYGEQKALALLAFIGGLSAGTAMVIVACVALAIMISNDLVLPLILRSSAREHNDLEDMESMIMQIRRMAIFGVLALGLLYYRTADNSAALASIGLVSFAAIAQLAPPFFLGLFWRNGNARGAICGMVSGFSLWCYCLFLPTLFPNESPLVANGPFGIGWLRPQDLFGLGMGPLANGVIWSLLVNALSILIGSLTRKADQQERMQASLFVHYQSQEVSRRELDRSDIKISQLKDALSRYIGAERTERSFDAYWEKVGRLPEHTGNVDNELLRFSEQLLASSIGASSSRLVHTLLLKRYNRKDRPDIKLLNDASRALQFNRDVLQTAIDQLDHGISVFDNNFALASWNRKFRTVLSLPEEVGQAGISLRDIAKRIVSSNKIEEFDEDGHLLADRLIRVGDTWQLNLPVTNEVLEISTSAMPEGGIVIVWNNITDRVRSANALREANETLEKRVDERTYELEVAKQAADQANVSKTRFLAAAGHDILQPLNAAKLYASTLGEKNLDSNEANLASKLNRSLGSVEEILGSILVISKLDSPGYKTDIVNFPLREVTEQLELEFQPLAEQCGLKLRFVHSSKWVRSDKSLLRRLLQNFVSNALKFTKTGKVLIGTRASGSQLSVQVLDTGIGIDTENRPLIFNEFTRLSDAETTAPGLGLGLSIVERIADLLGHQIAMESQKGKGSKFSVKLQSVTGLREYTPTKRSSRNIHSKKLFGTKILCIDNDKAILDGMVELLGQWGCEVQTATSRREAKACLKKSKTLPHLVLTDFHLDDETGVELFAHLRKKFGQQLKGALVTADRSEEVKKQAAENDMPVINKPVAPAALRALVSQYRLVAASA